MASKTPEDRLDRVEAIIQIIAEDQQTLQKIVTEMATTNRINADQAAQRFAENERRTTRLEEQMRQTDERMRQTDEQMRRTGERIDKLVIAIGEFIRRSSEA